MSLTKELIEQNFPSVDFAIGYGSAIFKQLGYTKKDSPMIDMIFAVEDPVSWHQQNIQKNRHHYSGLRFSGARRVAQFQNIYPGLYFNTLCPIQDLTVKYGVISSQLLVEDLRHWASLYVAGRMHKPVLTLVSNDKIAAAQEENLRHAFCYALLILPPSFTDITLFSTICSISYAGDIRMGIAENPQKIQNIVLPNKQAFHELYDPLITRHLEMVSNQNETTFEFIDQGKLEKKIELFNSLPERVRNSAFQQLDSQTRRSFSSSSDPAFCEYLVRTGKLASSLQQASHNIVKFASLAQTSKGLFTAGISKSIVYLAKKISKTWKK